jgi:hypothetical protein
MPPQPPQQPYGGMGYAATQSPPIGREALVPGYMAEPAVGGAAPPSTPGPQGAFGAPPAYAPQPSELDSAYGSYVNELRRTFENAHDGLLADAGSSLIRISDWLLSNADTLGEIFGLCADND